MIERIKILVAAILDLLGINSLKLSRLWKHSPDSIRAVNYHRTPDEEMAAFRRQADWLAAHYANVDQGTLSLFLQGSKHLNRPGILITFDDGLENNYLNAAPELERHGLTGWFFISAGLIGTPGYMTWDQVRDLQRRGHVIGCHTWSHHRMSVSDSDAVLDHEIVEAGRKIAAQTGTLVQIFCWCGGEEDTYTAAAQQRIRSHYRYSFLTNSALIRHETDPFLLQRTNVEARWPMCLVRFQLCGFMDDLYRGKRERVNAAIH